MLQVTSAQINKRWDDAPDEILEAIGSEINDDFIWRTCESEHIPEEKIGKVARYTGLVLLGFIHPEDLVGELADAAKINKQVAVVISDAINRRIFQPLDPILKKIYRPPLDHDENIDVPVMLGEIPKPSFSVTTPPAPSVPRPTGMSVPKPPAVPPPPPTKFPTAPIQKDYMAASTPPSPRVPLPPRPPSVATTQPTPARMSSAPLPPAINPLTPPRSFDSALGKPPIAVPPAPPKPPVAMPPPPVPPKPLTNFPSSIMPPRSTIRPPVVPPPPPLRSPMPLPAAPLPPMPPQPGIRDQRSGISAPPAVSSSNPPPALIHEELTMKAIRPPMSLDLNMAVRKSLDAKPLTAPPVKPAVLELGSAPVEEIKSSEPLKTPRVVHYTELRTPLENSALPPAPASPTPSVRPSPATSSGAAPAPQTSGREVREITLDAPTGTPFPPESKDKPAGSK